MGVASAHAVASSGAPAGGEPCLESERAAAIGARDDALHREARIVYLLASGEAAPRLIAPLLAGIDWQRLLFVAAAENAIIALRECTLALPAGSVPLDAERQLAVLGLGAEYRMRTLERRVEEMLVALDGAGITAIVLKGVGLAATVYRGFRDRVMNDADLLVDPGQAHAAREIALGLGWEADPTLHDDAVYAAHHHLPPLRDGGGSGLRIEIHRALFPPGHPFAMSVEELHADARPIRVGRAPAWALAPHHQALHAATHFAWSHAMLLGGWHAVRDVGTLQRAGVLDWARLTETAERWRAGSCCFWTLRLARGLAAVDVPDAVLERLRPPLPEAALARLERHFAQQMLRAELCPSLRIAHALWTLALQPRRAGHGSVRPWLVSPELTFRPEQPGLGSETRRLLGHLGRADRWRRYLSAMLGV